LAPLSYGLDEEEGDWEDEEKRKKGRFKAKVRREGIDRIDAIEEQEGDPSGESEDA